MRSALPWLVRSCVYPCDSKRSDRALDLSTKAEGVEVAERHWRLCFGLAASIASTTDQAVDRLDPVEPSHLLGHAIGPQKIAHRSARPDDAKCDSAIDELAVQLMQHARAGEIEAGRCRKIANHQPDLG